MRQRRIHAFHIGRSSRLITLALVLCAVAACGSTTSPSSAVQQPTQTEVAAVVTTAPTDVPPTEPVASETAASPTNTPTIEPDATAIPIPPSSTLTPDSTETPAATEQQIVGTVVRFATPSASVDVTIGEDNPAVRDFLAMLPLTLRLEEFAGKEKLVYLPRPLAHAGSPGSDPEDGDLIYYIPWNNLGFYYNAEGIGYSDQTIHLGTYQATRDQLAQLEEQDVVVDVVR